MAVTIVPYINPLEFYEKGFANQAQYNNKHLNDFPFADQIYSWQQRTSFYQVWQLNDSIRLQFRSEIGPNAWKLFSTDGAQIDTGNFQQVLQNADNPGEYVYQADIDLSIYDPGCLYMEIWLGVGQGVGGAPLKTLISEQFEFSNLIENTLLLQWSNSSFKDEVMYETGVVFTMRLKGRLFYKTPASKDIIYEDQELNETIVDSKNYDLWELQLSDERGIPNWMIRKINGILSCDNVIIEGRNYTKSEGAKLEETAIDDYPMRGWKIELREQLNRRARYFDTDGSTNQGHSVVVNTDSKGFVEEETGGSEYQILDVQ